MLNKMMSKLSSLNIQFSKPTNKNPPDKSKQPNSGSHGRWMAGSFFFDLENKSGQNDEPHMAASDLHALITGHHEPNVRLVPHASNPDPPPTWSLAIGPRLRSYPKFNHSGIACTWGAKHFLDVTPMMTQQSKPQFFILFFFIFIFVPWIIFFDNILIYEFVGKFPLYLSLMDFLFLE